MEKTLPIKTQDVIGWRRWLLFLSFFSQTFCSALNLVSTTADTQGTYSLFSFFYFNLLKGFFSLFDKRKNF